MTILELVDKTFSEDEKDFKPLIRTLSRLAVMERDKDIREFVAILSKRQIDSDTKDAGIIFTLIRMGEALDRNIRHNKQEKEDGLEF